MKELKIETLLPIGSVVMLKGANQELMITGTCIGQEIDGKTEVHDYLGCLWPMGVLDTNKNFVFNRDEIDKVIFKGLENDGREDEIDELEKNESLDIDLDNQVEKQGDNNGNS